MNKILQNLQIRNCYTTFASNSEYPGFWLDAEWFSCIYTVHCGFPIEHNGLFMYNGTSISISEIRNTIPANCSKKSQKVLSILSRKTALISEHKIEEVKCLMDISQGWLAIRPTCFEVGPMQVAFFRSETKKI